MALFTDRIQLPSAQKPMAYYHFCAFSTYCSLTINGCLSLLTIPFTYISITKHSWASSNAFHITTLSHPPLPRLQNTTLSAKFDTYFSIFLLPSMFTMSAATKIDKLRSTHYLSLPRRTAEPINWLLLPTNSVPLTYPLPSILPQSVDLLSRTAPSLASILNHCTTTHSLTI